MTLLRVTLPAPPPLRLLQVYKNVHSTVEEGGDEETRAAITAKVLHPHTSYCLVCIESSSPVGRLHSPSLPPSTPPLLWATVAAFAASEGHAHPRLVELEKVNPTRG